VDASTRKRMADDLRSLLTKNPGQHKRQLLKGLQSRGWTGLTSTDVNSVLYGISAMFVHDDHTPPLWRVDAGCKTIEPTPQPRPTGIPRLYSGPPPRAWQIEALDAWRAADRRGVVEAVTGTGKTAVGILAAAEAIESGRRVLILVPGRDLLDQWYEKVGKEIPGRKIGRFGDGCDDGLAENHVVVSTVQSACRRRMLPAGQSGLLIADEVHRYGADAFANALEEEFDQRLGLTATYEREDNGLEQYVTPYFLSSTNGRRSRSPVVMHCDYERALADDILARFRIGLVGVSLTPSEQEEYDEYDEAAKKTRSALIRNYGCPESPFGEFMRAANQLAEGGNEDSRATRVARQYLNAFSKRRALLAESDRKAAALDQLAPVLARADRGLVFTETKLSAESAAAILRQRGIAAQDFTSDLKRDERKQRLRHFKEGRIRVLAAPRVLDEGVDVPEADVGVIVAASRSRRQMIQRMGRIIRPKEDRHPAVFFVLYVRGTAEDPDLGGHGTFLKAMTDTAEEVHVFSPSAGTSDLLAWFAEAANLRT